MGIVFPGGQEVGDWKSGDQMGVRDQMHRSLPTLYNVIVDAYWVLASCGFHCTGSEKKSEIFAACRFFLESKRA